MDIENLIGTMIEGSLTSRRKRSRGAGRFLRHGGGSFINASTLLTVGGLIWGAIETMQQQSAAGTGGSGSGTGASPTSAALAGAACIRGPRTAAPPPLPPVGGAGVPGRRSPEGAGGPPAGGDALPDGADAADPADGVGLARRRPGERGREAGDPRARPEGGRRGAGGRGMAPADAALVGRRRRHRPAAARGPVRAGLRDRACRRRDLRRRANLPRPTRVAAEARQGDGGPARGRDGRQDLGG